MSYLSKRATPTVLGEEKVSTTVAKLVGAMVVRRVGGLVVLTAELKAESRAAESAPSKGVRTSAMLLT